MRRPSFQWYPADWRNNANLRRCTWASRGAWVDVLGLFHDSDEYGVLRWPWKQIAAAIGCQNGYVRELIEKSVLKGCDGGVCESYIYTPRSGRVDGEPVVLIAVQTGPIWYSSRMVRDDYIRMHRGGDDSPMPTPKHTFGETPKRTFSPRTQARPPPQSSSSSASPSVATNPSDSPQPQFKPSAPTPLKTRGNGAELPTTAVWQAYSRAYFARYGTEPTRNERTNGQLAQFVARLGKDEAPHVSVFYVGTNVRRYVERQHPVGMLLQDCEGLRTQWATGRTVTETQARQSDKTAALGSAVGKLIDEAKRAG